MAWCRCNIRLLLSCAPWVWHTTQRHPPTWLVCRVCVLFIFGLCPSTRTKSSFYCSQIVCVCLRRFVLLQRQLVPIIVSISGSLETCKTARSHTKFQQTFSVWNQIRTNNGTKRIHSLCACSLLAWFECAHWICRGGYARVEWLFCAAVVEALTRSIHTDTIHMVDGIPVLRGLRDAQHRQNEKGFGFKALTTHIHCQLYNRDRVRQANVSHSLYLRHTPLLPAQSLLRHLKHSFG